MQNSDIFTRIAQDLAQKNYEYTTTDFNRPWGGFFVIDEKQSEQFINEFFPEVNAKELLEAGKVSPKILAVAPEKRLSWQYHFRRAERWRVLEGPVAVAISETDEQLEPQAYQSGDLLVLGQGTRHRLIGLENWGIVAEIWIHTDPNYPSDESDIVRVQDDFRRD